MLNFHKDMRQQDQNLKGCETDGHSTGTWLTRLHISLLSIVGDFH